ncbi:hypothetical protein QQS21_007910 [Conoideocrella luteorostrata]|uniref:DUF7703 domain-containing protein n=1 Tax=Conoideocrella luteorostrata TaxID=1105319 RepID=A0AAJ0FWJ1_9HYPO|nr:hypothetical protein QQS21_007910 [Conoideocrella luteorostrata]
MSYIRDVPVADGTTNIELQSSNLATHMTIAGFTAIAWYNVIELNIAIYMGFKRKKGLYFWTMFLATQGITLHSLAFILKFYGLVLQYEITCTLITIGWYLMVTGQSLVLYSRLNLIVRETWIVRGVLVMILWNAVTLHVPTTVLTFGSNSPRADRYTGGFRIMEMTQMTIFSAQELVISATYIWATIRFLRPVYNERVRSVMMQLLLINITIIVMDVAMLAMEYLNFYSIEVSMKGAIYSVKLKLEFTVLNQLILLSTPSSHELAFPLEQEDSQENSGHESTPGSSSGRWGWGRPREPRRTGNDDDDDDDDGCLARKEAKGLCGHLRDWRKSRLSTAGRHIERGAKPVSAAISSHRYENGCHSTHIADNRILSATELGVAHTATKSPHL